MAKIKTAVKRTLQVVGGILVLFIGILIAIPYFYKNELLDQAKSFANEQINATLDFDNDKVGLSLLWTFPDFSFRIGDLSVTGHDEFEGKKLAHIGNFYFTINLMDVYNEDYNINGITISDADLYIKVLRNGKANYDIMKPSDSAAEDPSTTTTSTGGEEMKLSIKHWALENTNVIYDDEPSELYVALKNLNHSGEGDFTTSVFDLETGTTIDEFTVAMNGISYLKRADVAIDFNAYIDLDKKLYKVKDNSFRFNALTLNLEGEVEQPSEEDIRVDLKFNTPNTAFASVLSMIPAAYTKDFEEVETQGTFKLSGYAKGVYNGKKEKMPAFAIDLGVKDGTFKYPDLPLPVEEINTQIALKSSSADFDKMTLDVRQFHLKIGQNPFDAMLKLRTPISDPDIKAKVNGTINLTELGKAFPMEDVSELSGIIKANLETTTKMSYVNKGQYDKVDMKGMLIIASMNYAAKNLPPVKINTMAMNFTPNNVDLQNFDLKIGKSDLKATGKLDNILTYFSRDKIMKGKLSVQSNYLDLNEISNYGTAGAGTESTQEVAPEENLATSMQDTTTAVDAPIFDRFEFAMDMDFKQIDYDVHKIKNLKTSGYFSPTTAILKDLQFLIGKVDLRAKGKLENVFGYVFDDEIIKGQLTLYSNYMNLNQFMSEDGAAVEKEAVVEELPEDLSQIENDLQPIEIPANIDFTLYVTFKQFIYDTYKLKNVQAEAHVYDQVLDINALRANAFGGALAMNGKYDAKNPKKPKFEFGYDVSQLNIQDVAKQVALSKRWLPILESIYGMCNSEFKINGVLNENLYPDMESLSAKGILKTFNTSIKNNNSLNQLSDKLNIKDLSKLDLGNTTNFFTIENGRLKIDPASYVVKGMDVIVGGSHGLDNSMDYDMKMRVPRALLAGNAVGAAANNAISAGLGVLGPQAKKLGIDLGDSEYLNIDVGIGGTVTKPKFKVNLLGAEGKGGKSIGGQAADLLKEEAERVKAEMEAKAKAEAERLKQEAEAKLKAEADRLKKEAEEKARKLAQQAASNPSSLADSLKKIDPSKVIKDPGNILKDPNNLGNLLGGKKDKKGDDKKKKNPFGNFKNPFGPK